MMMSTLGQNGQDKVSDDPDEAESDSGNSLFITQIPVPEAVRSVKRHHSRLRSDPTSPREREGSEDDDSSSASQSESVLSYPVKSSKNGKRRSDETRKLKKYIFPFLRRLNYVIPKSGRERMRRGIQLTMQQNAVLQNSSVGGFFKCVKALWKATERGSTREQPMVGKEETLSPLREEDNITYCEGIKVVERKYFATSSKAKCSQAWYTPSSPERTSLSVPVNGEMSDEHLSDRIGETHDPLSFPDLMSDDVDGAARKKRKKKKTRAKRDCRVIEKAIDFPSNQEGPDGQDTGTSVNVEMAEVEETPVLSEDNGVEPLVPRSSGEMEHSGKNGRKKSSSHGDKILSQEESSVELPQDKDSITQMYSSQLKKKKKKRKKKKSAPDVIMREELEEGPSQNLSFHSERVDESSSRALPQDSAGSRRQLECNVNQVSIDNSVSQLESPVMNKGREQRKKKRKRVRENDDAVVELSSDAGGGPVNIDVEMQRKKKKRKKERRLNLDPPQKFTGLFEESGSPTPTQSLEHTEVSQGTINVTIAKNSEHSIGSSVTQLEDVIEPRKKRKKKKQSSSHDDTEVRQEEENVDIITSNDAICLTGSTVQKKKKKRKISVSSVTGQDEETAISNTPEEIEMDPEVKNADKSQTTTDVELVPKKKKRKKSTALSAGGLTAGTVAQSDDSVSVRKKKKKKKEANSFLVDDTVEQDAETHQETSAPSPPLVVFDNSRQKRKKKLGVNACDLETEPLENVDNLEESVTGSGDAGREKKRKKKKKASSSQDSELKGHEEDFEKPKDKCQRSETTDTGVERKKKRKKNKLETPGAADMGCSQTDETVVLKKKKKKCKDLCSELQDITPTSVEDEESDRSAPTDSSSVSHKKKSRQSSIPLDPKNRRGLTAEIARESSSSGQMLKKKLKKMVTNVCETDVAVEAERASSNPVSNAVKEKKKKKCADVFPEGTLSPTEPEPHAKKKKKEKERMYVMPSGPVLSDSNSPQHFETSSSSNHIKKKKHTPFKRRLHNPDQDFLAVDG